MSIVVVSVTQRGRALAERLPWEHVHGGAAGVVRERWASSEGFVLMLAVGAAVRLVAPLLNDKRTDPAVVCVDEAGRYAVPVCGGHAGGANDLARTVAAHLGAEPVITTATDSVGLTGLDQLEGFVVEGDVAGVTAGLLDGRPVAIDNPMGWPVPWPASMHASPASEVRALVTDRVVSVGALPRGTAVLHPPSLVVGVGTSSDASPEEVETLVAEALGAAGLARGSVVEVATIDRRSGHPAIVGLGLPVRTFAAPDLAGVAVPNPSAAVRDAVGTPSVCEAAALLGAGPGASLVVPKQSGRAATVAVARRPFPRGHLAIVGLGPGGPLHRTAAAERAVRRASVVVGYHAYVEQCADLLRPGQEVIRSPIGDEVVRAKQALAEAAAGRRVALVCSGDAGVYGMASIACELAGAGVGAGGGAGGEFGGVDIEVVPGVTAALAAASLLGAPLGHDHVAISLSDLLTPWATIEARLRAAATADLVVSLYNPRSAGRHWQLDAARRILLEQRPPSTPVGVVTDAGRGGGRERVVLTTLAGADVAEVLAGVSMTSVVIVGSTTTRVIGGRMVTPRGYRPGRQEGGGGEHV